VCIVRVDILRELWASSDGKDLQTTCLPWGLMLCEHRSATRSNIVLELFGTLFTEVSEKKTSMTSRPPPRRYLISVGELEYRFRPLFSVPPVPLHLGQNHLRTQRTTSGQFNSNCAS
jgi:hypothetical protein